MSRVKDTGAKDVFWLAAYVDRAHDASLSTWVKKYLSDHDTIGLDIQFWKPADACTVAWDRAQGLPDRSLPDLSLCKHDTS